MRWLREPLVHFLALGAVLFLVFGLAGDSGGERDDRITVSTAQVELLAQGFARTWQRPPTTEELEGLVDDFVREEIYYREALAMGLDRDDTIIRRRLRQKMEFFTDDLFATVEPKEEELRAYLEENPKVFRVAPRVTFEHVYFNADRRGAAVEADAAAALAALLENGERVDPATLGDTLPLPREYPNAPLDRVDSRFGGELAERLKVLPVGAWTGPVESGYGLHLVRIAAREPGRSPAFEDVREIVEREWRAGQRAEAREAFYRGLRERYSVVVGQPGEGGGESAAATAAGQ